MSNRNTIATLAAIIAVAAFSATAHAAEIVHHNRFIQTNLVSDTPSIPAAQTDPNLHNPWGVAFFPGNPFWLNANNSGIAELKDGAGNPFAQLPAVTIPPPAGSPNGTIAAPDGIVANFTGQFLIPSVVNGAPQAVSALFIFDTEDGTISAWNLNQSDVTKAQLIVDNSDGGTGAVYKGLAAASNSSGNFIYATNFRSGKVDVFDSNFAPATLAGSFTDPDLPARYAPFGIQNINGELFVTYAEQNAPKHDPLHRSGHGFVDVFDTDGNLLRRFASRDHLDAPWGVVMAPASFSDFGNVILIGNFGNGQIHAYDPSGKFAGTLTNSTDGLPLRIDGLWSLVFGGGLNSSPATLYFTAGPNLEQDGIFGTLAQEK